MTTSDPPPDLRGARVLLRRPQAGDVEARLALGYDPEIVRAYGGSRADIRPMSQDDAERWVRHVREHPHAWVVDAGGLIGSIRLDRVDLRDRRASLALGIEDRARLGQGLGTEAIRLVMRHAFETLGLHRLSVRVVAYNARAIRAYETCGFVVEGREREAALVDGSRHDDVMMGILASEFAAREARP